MKIFSKHWPFVAFIVLLMAGLSMVIYNQEQIINSEKIAILETRPVDPRDLLRGEYVILRYAIEADAGDLLDANSTASKAFIILDLNEQGVASVQEVVFEEPTNEVLYIGADINGRLLTIPDINQYYLEEGTGKSIEDMIGKLQVQVGIKDGEVRIVQLLDSNFEPVLPTKEEVTQ